jgi:hypothetical protein
MTTESSTPDLRQLLSEAIAAAGSDLATRLGTDPVAHLDLIALVLQARSETDVLLRSAISAARSAGCTWDAIGQVLAMSRQAAQQRFGKEEPLEARPGGRVLRLAPLSAVNEMQVLDRAGRYGWHGIGFGALYHVVQKSDQQWEHRRALVVGAEKRWLEAEGWEQFGGAWFPWVYYKRCTGEAALPEPTTDDYLMRP